MTEAVIHHPKLPVREGQSAYAVSERLRSPLIAMCLSTITGLPLESAASFWVMARGEGHLLISPIDSKGKHGDLFTIKADSGGHPILCVTRVDHAQIAAQPEQVFTLLGLIIEELEASRQAETAVAQ